MSERFVILTWHALRVLDNSYAGNDLIAFEHDLGLLDRLGWTILPLSDALDGLRAGRLPERTAVLTLDDGSILDYHDFDHPGCGHQPSILSRLRAFRDSGAAERHRLHASAFVIASPGARAELDRRDYMNLGVWRDDWWREANASRLLSIENHSWDHNHASLERTAQRDNRRGNFHAIDSEAECRQEVDAASDYIERRAGRRPRFFAYPYGQASDYLRGEYLPGHAERLGLRAALACAPEPVTRASDPWFLPRYVCGTDWTDPSELEALLRDASA
jgi:peptidoglycan/xylan/chitin deacetylase (PgdA/CDA1 family)